jgi:hypothetical protein
MRRIIFGQIFCLLLSSYALCEPECSTIGSRNVDIGFKCQTSRGAIFERVHHKKLPVAWKDQDGVIWSDLMVSTDQNGNIERIHDHNSGYILCDDIGTKMPSMKNYTRGETLGFREVLPGLQDYLSTIFYVWARDVKSHLWKCNSYNFDVINVVFRESHCDNPSVVLCITH